MIFKWCNLCLCLKWHDHLWIEAWHPEDHRGLWISTDSMFHPQSHPSLEKFTVQSIFFTLACHISATHEQLCVRTKSVAGCGPFTYWSLASECQTWPTKNDTNQPTPCASIPCVSPCTWRELQFQDVLNVLQYNSLLNLLTISSLSLQIRRGHSLTGPAWELGPWTSLMPWGWPRDAQTNGVLGGCESVVGLGYSSPFLNARQTLNHGQALPVPPPGATWRGCSRSVTFPYTVLRHLRWKFCLESSFAE